MNLSIVKEHIYDIVKKFFADAMVIWVEQKITKPKVPYVTLKTGNINKSTFPCHDDMGFYYYNCDTLLEVNLYTQGCPVTIGENLTGNFENTAVEDLMEFILYLESEAITDQLSYTGIDIQLIPPVRNLTELMNESSYRYRAMAEFTINYVQEASGFYGISSISNLPNSSGGGCENLQKEQYEIKQVEVKEES